MIIRIDEILKEKNKTRNWLTEQTGIAYKTIVKLCKNESISITLEYMDRLCSALDCNTSDIFENEKFVCNKRYNDAKNKLRHLTDEEKEMLFKEMMNGEKDV